MLAALDQVLDIVGGWNLPLKVLLVSSLLVFTACSYLWLASRNAKLSHIPGPWIARYTDAWALYNSWRILRARQAGGPRNDSPRHRALQKRYGDVVRVGPRSVLVYDARAVPVIYSLRSRLEKVQRTNPSRLNQRLTMVTVRAMLILHSAHPVLRPVLSASRMKARMRDIAN